MARLAGFPDLDFFFVGALLRVEPFDTFGKFGIERFVGMLGMDGMPELLTCFIIFCAAVKRSTRLLTSETLRPQPIAIRARLEPFSTFGFARSVGVIDSTIDLERTISP